MNSLSFLTLSIFIEFFIEFFIKLLYRAFTFMNNSYKKQFTQSEHYQAAGKSVQHLMPQAWKFLDCSQAELPS